MEYSETLKFKDFEIFLESGKYRTAKLNFKPHHILSSKFITTVFHSFLFTKEDIQDIINGIENFYSDEKEVYETKSLIAVYVTREEDDTHSVDIATDKTFTVLPFADKDEVIKFQSALTKAYYAFDN